MIEKLEHKHEFWLKSNPTSALTIEVILPLEIKVNEIIDHLNAEPDTLPIQKDISDLDKTVQIHELKKRIAELEHDLQHSEAIIQSQRTEIEKFKDKIIKGETMNEVANWTDEQCCEWLDQHHVFRNYGRNCYDANGAYIPEVCAFAARDRVISIYGYNSFEKVMARVNPDEYYLEQPIDWLRAAVRVIAKKEKP